MNTAGRRLILDRCFDRALESVFDAFVREGFTVDLVAAGDLQRQTSRDVPLRYALLDATLPELDLRDAPSAQSPTLLGCRVSVFEMAGSCTLVTAENPIGGYPALASLVPRIAGRARHAMRLLSRVGTLNAA